MKRTTTFALLASALMLFSIAAPAGASDGGSLTVSVTQDGGDALVTVTTTGDNASVPAENASVTVESTDENTTYGGSYVTDANGTVSLPAPAELVNISVTATYDNESASTTATLAADDNATDGNETDENATGDNETAFGQQVSAFVHGLQESNDTSDAPLGVQIAAFVVANNPGNAPDHAGPPEWLVNDSVNRTTGPPAHAGPSENRSAGPPDNRSGGPPDDAGKNGNGPPDDRGNGKDRGGGPPDDRGNDGDKGGGPPGDRGGGPPGDRGK